MIWAEGGSGSVCCDNFQKTPPSVPNYDAVMCPSETSPGLNCAIVWGWADKGNTNTFCVHFLLLFFNLNEISVCCVSACFDLVFLIFLTWYLFSPLLEGTSILNNHAFWARWLFVSKVLSFFFGEQIAFLIKNIPELPKLCFEFLLLHLDPPKKKSMFAFSFSFFFRVARVF